MKPNFAILRTLLAAEALLFLPGLPAWEHLAGATLATRAYLLCVGVFAAVALVSWVQGRESFTLWAWATAISNLPVYPGLTLAGIIIAAILIMQGREGSGRSPERPGLDWSGWLTWATCLVFCWAGSWQVHRFAALSEVAPLHPLALFAGLWLALPCCLVVHQAGHWVAGLQAGMRETSAWSGWADPQPVLTEGYRSGRRLLLWTLGGPLASLAFAAAMAVVFIFSPGQLWSAAGELAGLMGVCSLAIFGVSFAPWREGGYRSDGAVMLSNLRRGREFERDRAIALLAGDWLAGTRPRNWDPDWLRMAGSLADGSRHHATACGLNYLFCLDKGFDGSARYWIGRLNHEFAGRLHSVPVRWRLEAAHFLAFDPRSGPRETALAWRRSAGRGGAGAPSSLIYRCDAAMAMMEGRTEEALALIGSAERLVLARATSFSEFELDALAQLRARVECESRGRVRTTDERAAFDLAKAGSLQWDGVVL